GDAQSGLEFTYHSTDTIQERRRDTGRWLHGAWPGLTRICFVSRSLQDTMCPSPWFLGHSAIELASGADRTFTLHLQPLDSRKELPQVQANSGGLGIRLIPGPALPVNEPLIIAIHGGVPPFTVDGPYVTPAKPTTAPDCITTTLTAPGEHVVTVRDSAGATGSLILMGLKPVDALMERRTDFILANQVFNETGHSLSGAILCWNNRTGKVLAIPNDMWGSGGYEGGVTDAQFMAMKNVFQPDPAEITRLETYIEHWLLGAIQDTETFGVAWMVTQPERTERGYNYIHVLNLYDAMARASSVWPDLFRHDPEHYLQLWFNTFKAYNGRNVRFRDLGLMGRGNMTRMPPLFRRLGREMEASEIEEEIHNWVEYWVAPPAFPYGSELFFDNTGYETVALYCEYDLRTWKNLTVEQIEARKRLIEQTISVTEAGRGRAPAWFWNDSDQRWWDAVRTSPQYDAFTDFGENCHHYMTGLNGYMLLDLYDRGYNRDEPAPIGFSGLLAHLGRITESGFAGMCSCPDPSSDNYGLNQFSGDVGLGLWGGLLGLRCYYLDDPDAGFVSLGGRVSAEENGDVTIRPWSGIDHALRWMVDGDVNVDTEGLVIRSVTRAKNGDRWIVKLANPTRVEGRSRICITGLRDGTWSVTWRGKNGHLLDSKRHTLETGPLEIERIVAPGAEGELVLARENVSGDGSDGS
ncbi:hypothetical protein JXA80_08010, partial [bacterium]|nr:hypothetical protein [candidate division CSSED10-310 bacterium]